jgi:xanthine/CO dehydrogenase XdhC/CoxF family maturation factor
MLNELGAEGPPSHVYGPVGLDIGTETPEEIALATVAEIQAVMHRRDGGYLRDRETPIHMPQAVGEQAPYPAF